MGFVIQVPCRTEAKAQNLGAQLRACCRRMEGRGGSRAPAGLAAKCCANCKARLK